MGDGTFLGDEVHLQEGRRGLCKGTNRGLWMELGSNKVLIRASG